MNDKTDVVNVKNGLAAARTELPPPGFRLPPETGSALGLVGVTALFLIVLTMQGHVGSFVSADNIQLIFNQNAIRMTAVLGTLFVIVSGGIDLSIGSVVGLSAAAAVMTYQPVLAKTGSESMASAAAVGAALAAGALCGAANGLTITGLRLTPFVTTLGMMSIARGLTCWLLADSNVTLRETPAWVNDIQRSGGHPYLFFDPGVWSVLALAVVAVGVLRYTIFGRYVYAIGSNESTARLCGVNVGLNKVAVYTLAGLLTGWAGVIAFAHHSGGADADLGKDLELEVIAAAVIGGASLRGGQGTVLGVLLGVLIWGVLENGVNQCGAPNEVKYILIGVILVANTALSQWRGKR